MTDAREYPGGVAERIHQVRERISEARFTSDVRSGAGDKTRVLALYSIRVKPEPS